MSAQRKQALAFFIRQGWTPQQSAGIVANLEAESGLRPDAVGDGGAAFGVAQWHRDRQTNFASVLGKDIHGSSLEEQLYFVHAELRGTERRAGDSLDLCTTAEEAGACVSKFYERPADTVGEAAKRAHLAGSIYADLVGQPNVATFPEQPSAPTPEAPMPDVLGAVAGVAAAINPAAGFALGLANSLIDAFSPLAREKIANGVNKHSDNPAVGGQVADSILAIAKSLSGQQDPVAAVMAVKSDLEMKAKAETATLAKMDELAPYLDKVAEYQEREWNASEDSMDRAAKRTPITWDMTKLLALSAVIGVGVILISLMAALIIYALNKQALPEMLLTLIVQTVTGILGFAALLFTFRFGSSRSSAAKDETVAQLVSRRPQPPKVNA